MVLVLIFFPFLLLNLFLFVLIIIPWSLQTNSDLTEVKKIDDQSIGYYQINTCSVTFQEIFNKIIQRKIKKSFTLKMIYLKKWNMKILVKLKKRMKQIKTLF